MSAKAEPLATAETCSFWRIGDNVYRVNEPWSVHFLEASAFDSYGHPLGKRWECSFEHWKRCRNALFAWAKDISQPIP